NPIDHAHAASYLVPAQPPRIQVWRKCAWKYLKQCTFDRVFAAMLIAVQQPEGSQSEQASRRIPNHGQLMTTAKTDRRSLIKWTLFVLAFESTLAIGGSILLSYLLATSGGGKNSTGVLFLSATGVAFAWWIISVRKRLVSGDESAWASAVMI